MGSRLRPLVTLARLRSFRNAYVRRGVAIWVLVRMTLAWAKVVDPGVPTEIVLLGVVGLAVLLDARRRSEDLFLGNLGIPGWAIAVMALPLVALAELIVP